MQVCIACLYLYCRLMSNYHEGKVEILLNGLTPPHLCVYSKARNWIYNVIYRDFFLLLNGLS